MSSPLAPLSPNDTVLNLLGAISGVAPSSAQFTNALRAVSASGDSAVAAQLSGTFASFSNAQYTTYVLNNLGVTASSVPKASYDILVDALNIFFGVYPLESRGQITLNLSRLLSGLTEDATYGAAARAWVAFKEAALGYSTGASATVPLSPQELQSRLGVELTVSRPAVAEGTGEGGLLTFTVSAAKPVFAAITLNYRTEDGSGESGLASPGSDYASAQGTVTIQPGQSSASFTVRLVGDSVDEADESIRVSITGGPLKGALVSTAKILDDDGPLIIGGRVIDGYVSGATVFIDYNGNGVADSDLEKGTQVTTGADGSYRLSAPQAGGTIVGFGGVNVDTGNANTLVLKAPAVLGENSQSSANITPITTLITAVAEKQAQPGAAAFSPQALAAAESLVRTSLNLGSAPGGPSLLTLDPVAVATSPSASADEKAFALNVFKTGVAVAVISAAAQGTANTEAERAAAAAKVLTALVDKIATPAAGGSGGGSGGTPTVINLSDPTVLTAVLTSAVSSPTAVAAAAASAAAAVTQVATATSTTAVATVQNKFEDVVNPAGSTPATPAGGGGTTPTGGGGTTPTGGGGTTPTGGGGTTPAPNVAPTLAGVPSAAQPVWAGTAADLDNFTVADANGDVLSVSLLPSNGTLGGLTDADPSTAGVQLRGSAAQINAALAGAQFTATGGGAATVAITVSDAALSASGTYSLFAGAGTLANPADTATVGNDWLNCTRGSREAPVTYNAAQGNDTFVISLNVAPSNVIITNFAAGDVLYFSGSLEEAKARFFRIGDDGSDIVLYANLGGGVVQQITLIGLTGSRAGVGGAIDNIDELIAFLGSAAVLFGG